MADDQRISIDPNDAVVNDMTRGRFYSDRDRQVSIDMFLNAIDHTDLNFERLLYTATDFFHSVFVNGVLANASSDAERDQIMARMARSANHIVDALEAGDENITMAEELVSILTVILDILDMMFRANNQELK